MNNERRKQFPFDEFEPKWQRLWEDAKAFRTPGPGDADFDSTKPKYYALDMFPYPSGQGLHVGHPEGYTATDIVTRFKKMRGFNVLHPMGWDAFGLPAEQYAIKTGQHPRTTTEANIEGFRAQLKRLGFAYDWEREVNTTDPAYYKWTQWIFLQLYHSYFDEQTNRARPVSELEAQDLKREEIDAQRLAYVKEAPVWWCPELGTVLANEEVVDGKSEVGGFPVERRPMRQWMLRITAYAQRLIDELDGLNWPEGIKLLQKNWIGKSEGAEVHFKAADLDETITVFTTRPDTLFGATYMVLAPEHRLVDELVSEEQLAEVEQYRERTARKSDLERTELAKEKSGVFTGAYAINPVNKERIPIWIADYVLMGYGTGAIMAVPAHDERDFEFANKFGLPVRQVLQGSAGVSPVQTLQKGAQFTKHRRRLPHWQQGECAVFVTWRLADSLPKEKLDEWNSEREAWKASHPEPWSEQFEDEYHARFSDQLDKWLDSGGGSCVLRRPEISAIVAGALNHFDGDRCTLHAAVVMPNHVHLLFQPVGNHKIEDIIQSLKSFTAKQVNKLLGSEGRLWQPEYFDRLVRSLPHFERVSRYISENPVVAGLREGEFVLIEKCTGETPALPYESDGVAVNSDFLNGLATPEAKSKITAWLTEKGLGAKTTNFKLRDWLFSRQRYWGEPFPIVWEDGHHRAVPESELPVVPPDLDDFKPTGTPEPPLSKATSWVRYSENATRELNTMPQWAGSCWYYLRYCDPKNTERFISKEAEAYWMGGTNVKCGMRNAESVSAIPNSKFQIPNSTKGGVDLYVGGTEHAVLHLLYARFWHKFLFDLGHVSTPEPFQRLVNQGLILGEDGQKMSKSRGNVVNPDDVILEYGADSLRLYEMFMGPLEQVKPWHMQGVEGVYRFLARVWRLVLEGNQEGGWSISPQLQDVLTDKKLNKIIHETIKKVSEDIEKLSFNTSISQMMVLTNAFTQAEVRPANGVMTLLQTLNPFAPHITEELAERIGGAFPKLKINGSLAHQTWPEFDASALTEDEMEIVLQVNGKLRDRLTVAKDIAKEELEKLALASAKVIEFTQGLTIRKVVVVPGKLVNIVAN